MDSQNINQIIISSNLQGEDIRFNNSHYANCPGIIDDEKLRSNPSFGMEPNKEGEWVWNYSRFVTLQDGEEVVCKCRACQIAGVGDAFSRDEEKEFWDFSPHCYSCECQDCVCPLRLAIGLYEQTIEIPHWDNLCGCTKCEFVED
jgi:hypothetical protein